MSLDSDGFYEKTYSMPYGYMVTMRWGRETSPTEVWQPRGMPEHIRTSPEMGDAYGMARASFMSEALAAAHNHPVTTHYIPDESDPAAMHVFHHGDDAASKENENKIFASRDMSVRKNQEAAFRHIFQMYLKHDCKTIKVIVTQPKFAEWLLKKGLPNNIIVEEELNADHLPEAIERCKADLSIWGLIVT